MSQNRVPALDGLRGVAVLLVLLSHSFNGMGSVEIPLASWTPGLLPGGGFAGVQLFFALSGYLITGILLSELERTRTVAIRAFWWRRVKRLYPALAVTCLALLAYSWLDLEVRPQDAAADVLGALTYTTNLLAATPGHGGYLGHTWSLAVEEQFYLAWPLLLLAAFMVRGRTGVVVTAIALAVLTISVRGFGDFAQGTRWELLRWDAILLGCAAGAAPRLPAGCVRMTAGVTAWATLAWFSMREGADAGAITATALASVLAVVSCQDSRALSSPPLRHFGTISYGLYLWSWPLLWLALPWWFSVALSVLVAEASWRYVERPILQAALR